MLVDCDLVMNLQVSQKASHKEGQTAQQIYDKNKWMLSDYTPWSDGLQQNSRAVGVIY